MRASWNFQNKSFGFKYLIFSWALPILITLLVFPFVQKTGASKIYFDPKIIAELKVEIIQRGQAKTIELLPNPIVKSPFIFYQATIKKITLRPIASEIPIISLSEYGAQTPTTKAIPLTEINGRWESPPLHYQSPITEFWGPIFGFYLKWVLYLSIIFAIGVMTTQWRKNKKELFFFFSIASYFALQTFKYQPGILGGDSYQDFNNILLGIISIFTGGLYSSLLIALIDINHSMIMPMLFNLLIAALLFTLVFSICKTSRLATAIYLTSLILFLSNSVNGELLLFQNRDVTFSLVFCIFLSSFSNQTSRPFTRCFLLLLTIMLRREAIFILPFFIFFEHRRNQQSLRSTLRYFLIPILFVAGYTAANLSTKYNATGYINPMMHIIVKRGKSVLTNSEIDSVKDFVDFDKSIKIHRTYDIVEFHFDTINKGLLRDPDRERKLRKIALRLIWDYPGDYLENRLLLSKEMLGWTGPGVIAGYQSPLNSTYLELNHALPTAPDLNRKLVTIPNYGDHFWQKIFFRSAVPQFLMAILSLFFFQWIPLTASASTLLLIRSLGLFALTPASYYKYAWSLSIWAALLPALALAEWQGRRLRKGESSV